MTGERDRATALESRVGQAIFGDRIGLLVFLGTLCAVTLTWRAGLFITDNATLVATLDALAGGRFWIERAGEGALNTPGTAVRDGLVYGRNYGQLVLSLPALWALRALDAVVSLRVALVGVWHLLALGVAVHVGRVVGRERIAAISGSALVLLSFLGNVALATEFFSPSIPLLALQVTTAVAAALVAVVLYRLLALRQGSRVGVLVGAGAVLAMPLAIWATIPKRHVFTALFVVGILLAFARSRESDDVRVPLVGPVPVYRAATYALVGLLTWVHAAEGLFVFLVLVAVDLPTAPRNDWRSLSFVGGVFALSMLPVAITNLAVTGEVFRPPRAIGGGPQPLTGNPGGSAGGASGGGAGSGLDLLAPLVDPIVGSPIGWLAAQVIGLTADSLWRLVDLDPAIRTFVASGIEGISQDPEFLGVNLSILESAPVLGAVVASGAGGAYRLARGLTDRWTPTDALALGFAVAFVLLYLNRLPLNTQLTVRYLLPLYPLGAVLLARSEAVGRLLADHARPLLWSYGAGVGIGTQLLFVGLVTGNYAVAEAARVHARLGLLVGFAVAVLGVVSILDRRARPVAAAGLGLAGAAGTAFFLLTTAHYFAFIGEYILPTVGAVSDLLAAAG